MSGIIAEEEAAVSSYSGSYGLHAPPLLSVILSSNLRFGVLRQNRWGPGGGQKWSRRGGGGAFLKGIITVRAGDVHGHSVNRLGVAREGVPVGFLHTSLSNALLNCGAVRRLLG